MAYTLSGLSVLPALGKVAGEAILQGELVAIHTDGKAYLAQAEAGANFQMACVGIAQADAASGEDVSIIRDDACVGGASGLTIGAPVYVGETTAGTITQVLPATTNDADQQIGVAISATEFTLFCGTCQYDLHA